MQASEFLNRNTKIKRSQADLADYVRGVEPVLGEKLKWCASWLHFREFYEHGETGETKLLNANFCKKHLLCQCCAVRRAGKMVETYEEKLEHVLHNRADLIPAMVTLTLKNHSDLANRLQHFKDSWKAMGAAVRKAKGSERHLPLEWNKVAGAVTGQEVTYGKGGWHYHMHAFVLLTDYMDYRKLSREWQRFTGDSKIVDVRKCKGGIKSGLVEVLKYSTKFPTMTKEQIYEVHSICGGSRMINSSGVLRGVLAGDIDSDSVEGMTGAYRDYMAYWFQHAKRYDIRYESDDPLQIERPDRPNSPAPSSAPTLPVLRPVAKHLAEIRVKYSNIKPKS